MTDAEMQKIAELAKKFDAEKAEAQKSVNAKYKTAHPDYNPDAQYVATADESAFSYINRKMKEYQGEEAKAREAHRVAEDAAQKKINGDIAKANGNAPCAICDTMTGWQGEHYSLGFKCRCGRTLNPLGIKVVGVIKSVSTSSNYAI